MLLSLMLIGCGNTQSIQDAEDIALTEAPMEEEQVSPEEKTFDSLVKLDEGIYMMYYVSVQHMHQHRQQHFRRSLLTIVTMLLRSMAKKKGNDIHRAKLHMLR